MIRIITLLVGCGLAATLIAGGLVATTRVSGGVNKIASFTPAATGDLKPLNVRSQVFDRYGNLIATWRGEQNRVPITLDRVPKHLIEAVLDMEDSEFYRHVGVNAKGMIRATAANVEAGGVAQGGSTITQQLVKLTILDSRQDVKRKVQEALIARRIEKKFSKNQILEQYLNTIYLGEGSYGVQAAAEQYFGKPVEALTLVDSAFLAGMIRNPVGYDPVRFRERSRQRRSTVLTRMLALGHITQANFEEYKREPMPRPADRLAKPETYFLEAAKQALLDDLRLGKTKTDRYNSVFSGGLQIRTTFDPYAQDFAERSIAENLPESASPEFAMALVSVDVPTGAVRALVGGPGFATYKYNLATQGERQPGSSWKPFTLIAALESGISPKSVVSGAEPCPIPNPKGKPDPYIPHNSSEGNGTTESIINQLVRSNNCAFARLAWIVGYDRIASVARRLGITTRIDLVPAMALGVEEVRPIQMAGAYATIAAGGQKRTPFLVEEVLDRNGTTVFKADHGGAQVISPEVAKTATAAMERVVSNGTGRAAALADRPAAGKTGTTNNYEDAWFVGFTPQIATAVWMGAPDRKLSMSDVGGIKVMGGTYPAKVWHDYMTSVLSGTLIQPFAAPDATLFEKGECLSIEAVLQSQADAERAAAKAVRDAEKARKATEKARRADEKARAKAAVEAAKAAAKAAKAAAKTAAKTAKASNSSSTTTEAAPAAVRGFGVGWMAQGDAPAPAPAPSPEPVPAAAAPSPVPVPEPADPISGSVPGTEQSGNASSDSSGSRPKPKSSKKSSKNSGASKPSVRRYACSDEALFGAARTDATAASSSRRRTVSSSRRTRSKTTIATSATDTEASAGSSGSAGTPVPVGRPSDGGAGPGVQPAEPSPPPASPASPSSSPSPSPTPSPAPAAAPPLASPTPVPAAAPEPQPPR